MQILPLHCFLCLKHLEQEANTSAPALRIKQIINVSINKATQQPVPNEKTVLVPWQPLLRLCVMGSLISVNYRFMC